MIIVGYQGIGKSTLASKDKKYIDLESSNFFVNGERDKDWYRVYVNIAINLHHQGYIVFTSSHNVVRDELVKRGFKSEVGICFPDLSLKDAWLEKLKDRYDSTRLEKDYKAYMNALVAYDNNIMELDNDCDHYGFNKLVIKDMDYKLEDILNQV